MLQWLPENVASYGGQIDAIMYVIYYVVGAWFLLAQGLLIYFVVRYWNRDDSDVDVPYVPANTWSVMAFVLVPAALVLACDLTIDFWQESAWAHIKEHRPEAQTRIKITGQQFSWKFLHAGPDGKLGTDDDISARNRLHVPVGSNVVFDLTSEDVIHSFWVPSLRLKQDAVPGRTIKGWFKANETGEYEIACAELCGVGHGVMKAKLIVHSEDDYKEWMQDET